MNIATLPLIQMKLEDDFSVYEKFVSSCMKPEDFYTGEQLQNHIASGYVTAYWMKDDHGAVIGWCGLNNSSKVLEDGYNFLGVAIAPAHRGTILALRMVRHILKCAKGKPISTYIQPGVETERLLKPLGFRPIGREDPWLIYVRD